MGSSTSGFGEIMPARGCPLPIEQQPRRRCRQCPLPVAEREQKCKWWRNCGAPMVRISKKVGGKGWQRWRA